MKKLTPRYRKRLAVLWTIEAAVIVCNVIAPSFWTMALPVAGCWLYVIGCALREGIGFERALSREYPCACHQWKAGGRGLRNWSGECPFPTGSDLRARWEAVRSVSSLAWRVFAGFAALVLALLGRGLLIGPYR